MENRQLQGINALLLLLSITCRPSYSYITVKFSSSDTVVTLVADKLRRYESGYERVYFGLNIRQPAKATGPDHLTDNLGNKVTATGCHGNSCPRWQQVTPSQMFRAAGFGCRQSGPASSQVALCI